MSERTVILGPYALGILKGLHGILNSEKYLTALPPIDIVTLFYTCMVQNGAKAFEIFSARDDNTLVTPSYHLASRVTRRDYWPQEKDIRHSFFETFDRFLPFDWFVNERFVPVHTLVNFIPLCYFRKPRFQKGGK